MAKHGSLAKAGKVRKQTIKVEKQERTVKPATGRCKLRKKYIKRFHFMKQTKQRKYNAQAKD
jgi:small subunit ribosomal protein S30e